MPAHALAPFQAHQASVLAVVAQAEQAIARGKEFAASASGSLYGELADALTSYQRYKHSTIYDPVIQSASDTRRIAVELKLDCVQLGTDYQVFLKVWHDSDVRRDWPKCRLTAHSIHRSVRDALFREAHLVPQLQVPNWPLSHTLAA
jgi:hypothetical protein